MLLLNKQKKSLMADLASRGVLRSSELGTNLTDLYGQAQSLQAQYLGNIETQRAQLLQNLAGQQMQYQTSIYGQQLGAAQAQQSQYLNFMLGQQQAGADIYQWQVNQQQQTLNDIATAVFGGKTGGGLFGSTSTSGTATADDTSMITRK